MNGQGFTAATWPHAAVFQGAVASPHDVDAAAAVFALGETINARAMRRFSLPQPVIWWEDEDEFAALAVQAEQHETDDGELMEVLGLLLPDGRTAVALLEDVEVVDGFDPVWIELLQAEKHPDLDGLDEDDDDGAELLLERGALDAE